MEFRDRKHPRLKNYDYSLPGYYYVTIHNEKGAPSLSTIRQDSALSKAVVRLTTYGKIAQQQLFALEKRYVYVKIDQYVIMPTHIHAIIVLTPGEGPRPTLMDIIRAYKSLTTRVCNERFAPEGRKLFQTSFYESVLRNEQAYRECWQYIEENPAKWLLNPEDI